MVCNQKTCHIVYIYGKSDVPWSAVDYYNVHRQLFNHLEYTIQVFIVSCKHAVIFACVTHKQYAFRRVIIEECDVSRSRKVHMYANSTVP